MKINFREHWVKLQSLDHGDRVALRWGILILCMLLFLLWVVLPYLEWRDNQQSRVQQDILTVSKLKALQRSVKEWQGAELQNKKLLEKDISRFFNASSYAQAQQDMYGELTKLLKQNRLQLISQSLVESNIVDVGEQISLQLNIQGDLADIINLVDTITHHQKIFIFKRLYIAKNNQVSLLQMNIAGYRMTAKAP